MVTLVNAYEVPGACEFLYELLLERPDYANISHKVVPEYEEHCRFFHGRPYRDWLIVLDGFRLVGSAYMTHNREVGIFIKKEFQGNGYAKGTVEMLIKHYGHPLYANIAPHNYISQNMFERQFGFKHIQNTYKLGD